MTKPVITKRTIKGTALTYNELDTNFQNLVDATIGITVGATSGTLNLNDALTFTAGSNITLGYNTTSKALTITGTGGITSVSGTAGRITSTGGTTPVIDLATSGVTSGSYSYPSISVDSYGRITAASSNTNFVTTDSVQTIGAAKTFGQNVTFNMITTLTGINEGVASPIFANTFTPYAPLGSVQKLVLTGNITINSFNTPVAGQSVTLILVQDSTGGRSLTSTMKFAGNSKTLTSTANAIDVLHIFYDGTNYLASLVKGFA